MKNKFYLKKKNLYSYSFSPYIFNLYREDILQITELVKENYPDSKIFFGKDGLDFEIKSRLEAEEFFKSEEMSKQIFNSFYIKITTGNTEESPYLIIELDKYSFNFIISGKDKKLLKIKNEIFKIFKKHRIYRFINNKLTKFIVLLLDILLFVFIFKFKDMVEKKLNFNISYITILLIFFILNLVFILPSGQNKIFLKSKKDVPFFRRSPELLNLLFIFVLFICLFIVGYFLKILQF